jgi:hypothetical protein
MTGAGPGWGSGKGAGWRACAKNGERVQWSRLGQGSAQQADLVGFRDQPKLKLASSKPDSAGVYFQCRMDGSRSGRPFPPSNMPGLRLTVCFSH